MAARNNLKAEVLAWSEAIKSGAPERLPLYQWHFGSDSSLSEKIGSELRDRHRNNVLQMASGLKQVSPFSDQGDAIMMGGVRLRKRTSSLDSLA